VTDGRTDRRADGLVDHLMRRYGGGPRTHGVGVQRYSLTQDGFTNNQRCCPWLSSLLVLKDKIVVLGAGVDLGG